MRTSPVHVDHLSEPVRFAGAELGEEWHICAFFGDPDEEYRVLLPFIEEGFRRGDKAFHVVAPGVREAHVERLRSAGVDVPSARHSGQLKLCDWEEAYLADGRFDMHRMLAMWEEELRSARKAGFSMTRTVAHMEWSLERRDGVTDLLEYEALLNEMPYRDHVVICTYDVRKYNGAMITDVMRTHPLIILGGMLHKNPFYVEPREFVRQLRARKG